MPAKLVIELDVRDAELILEGITVLLAAIAKSPPDGGSHEPARPDDAQERRLYVVAA